MYYSLFEIFAIGIGPSSSHTVGPMKAARRYVNNLIENEKMNEVERVEVTLYGSLALTGVGHGTLNAVVYGLLGLEAQAIDLSIDYIGAVKDSKKLNLGGIKKINFDFDHDIMLEKKIFLPEHANGMKFCAFGQGNNVILEETYFSVGGGTIARQDEMSNRIERRPYNVPYQFNSCKELIDMCRRDDLTISELVLKNEDELQKPSEVEKGILQLTKIMQDTITRGVKTEGFLPGGLRLKRRAPGMYADLSKNFNERKVDGLTLVDWVNMWAFAVAEENAAGGKIVTAPTMGSAGVLPAVMRYYQRFVIENDDNALKKANIVFLTTASAICSLYRANA